jgi:hypothetical protein
MDHTMWQRNSRGFFAVEVTESYDLTIGCFPGKSGAISPIFGPTPICTLLPLMLCQYTNATTKANNIKADTYKCLNRLYVVDWKPLTILISAQDIFLFQ